MSFWKRLFGRTREPPSVAPVAEPGISTSPRAIPPSEPIAPGPEQRIESSSTVIPSPGNSPESSPVATSDSASSASSSTVTEEDVERLIETLWDENREGRLRVGAAEALGNLCVRSIAGGVMGRDGERAYDALLGMMSGNHRFSVQKAALLALQKIDTARLKAMPDDIDRLIHMMGSPSKYDAPRCVSELVGIGEPAVERLCAALKDMANSWKRVNAVRALGRIGDARAVEPLCAALWDREPDVRESAGRALVKIGDAHGVEAIFEALRSTNEYGAIACSAARAAGTLSDARAMEALCVALGHESRRVRDAAVDALVELAAATRAYRSRAPEMDPSYRVFADGVPRKGITDPIVLVCDARVVDALYGALESANRQVREGAARALQKIGAPSTPQ